MTLQGSEKVVFFSEISLQYSLVFGSRAEDIATPSDGAYSAFMSFEDS